MRRESIDIITIRKNRPQLVQTPTQIEQHKKQMNNAQIRLESRRKSRKSV